MIRSHGFALALALGLLSPAISFGQSAENKAAAEALFAEGRRLMDAGHYAEACKKLEGSQRLDPGAGTLLNLAACYEQNGQTASSWATYKEAAIASQARHPDWAAQALAKVSALEPALSTLVIRVEPTEGLVVTRDGVTIESTVYGVPIPVDPGSHVIEGNAPGHKAFHTSVTIGKAKDAQQLAIPALEVGETPVAGGSVGSGQRIIAIGLMGGGVVGVALGSIFGAMALGKKNDASGSCSADFKTCSSGGKALVDDAKSLGLVSTTAFIAGGVLAVGGLVLFIASPRGEKKIQAAFGADGASVGMTLRGTF